jgi:hypothetical protein
MRASAAYFEIRTAITDNGDAGLYIGLLKNWTGKKKEAVLDTCFFLLSMGRSAFFIAESINVSFIKNVY